MISREKISTESLVLGYTRYKDDSAIITLSGCEGVYSVIAKGIFKANSQLKPLLIIGSYVEIEHNKTDEETPSFVSAVKVLHDASMLFTSYGSLQFLSLLSEISMAYFQYQDPYPYKQISYLLNALEEGKDPLSLMLLAVGIIYRSLGIEINTDHCVLCQSRKDLVSYDLEEGGYLCSKCLGYRSKKDTMSLYILRYAFSVPEQDILTKIVPKTEGIKVLIDLLERLTSYFDGKEIKSLSMFVNAVS